MAVSGPVHPIARRDTYMMILVLLVIFTAEKFFALGSWWHRGGVFNVQDVGNALLWVSLICIFTFTVRRRKVLWNPLTALIFFYIGLNFFIIILAHFNYGQSLYDGLVGVRHQFYYLAFFLFLVLLDDTAKIERLMNILVFVSIGLVVLAVINYFGPTVFSHKWAEGHGVRAGIKRAFIPGMDVIVFATIWIFTRYLDGETRWERRKSFWATAFLLAALLFRQTRMRIISVGVVMWGILLFRRKWRSMTVFMVLSLAALVIVGATMKQNVLVEAFSTAYEDVVHQTGTWKPRLKELRLDLAHFKRHPWVGSGTSAIRGRTDVETTRFREAMMELGAKSDLGYSNWLMSYGLVGVVWLVLFYYFQVSMALKVLGRSRGIDNILAHFALSYLLYEAVSFLTLNHMMFPAGIVPGAMTAAIIVRLYYKTSESAAPGQVGAALAESPEIEGASG